MDHFSLESPTRAHELDFLAIFVYDPSHIAFVEIVDGAPVLLQWVYGTSRIPCVFPDENFPPWSLLQGTSLDTSDFHEVESLWAALPP